jgi:hypothetical protein
VRRLFGRPRIVGHLVMTKAANGEGLVDREEGFGHLPVVVER